jgi:hypothetical protein
MGIFLCLFSTPSSSKLRFKRQAPEKGDSAPNVDERSADPERVVVCSSCTHTLAKVTDRLDVAGRHLHTCVNPAGYVYRIACYRRAAGVIGTGSFSDHHSWFAGYSWQIACCGRCSVHLGWAFSGEGEDFYGLIANRIDEG